MSIIIEKFQQDNGLTPDGDIGKKTLAVIKAKCNIVSDLELAHFMGQCHHETGGFKLVKEDLRYSSEGLMKMFKKYFPTKELADAYAKQPEKIANRVYANRMGNGNEASGDGFKFSGKGAIQLTGRDNYTMFSKAKGDPEILTNPDIVASKYIFESADFFFDRNNLWAIAKKGIGEDVIKELTKRINGGYTGLAERIEFTNHYYQVLTKK